MVDYFPKAKRSILIGLLGVLLLSTSACGPSESDFVEFGSFPSPGDEHRIVIETAPKSSFAFSSVVVRIYLVGLDADTRYLIAATTLANDGSRLTDENIRAEWVDSNTIRLCLSGSEQDDEAFVIDAANGLVSVDLENCS